MGSGDVTQALKAHLNASASKLKIRIGKGFQSEQKPTVKELLHNKNTINTELFEIIGLGLYLDRGPKWSISYLWNDKALELYLRFDILIIKYQKFNCAKSGSL